MAQGDFTKENATNAYDAVTEIMGAMPKSKAAQFIGHFNDVLLFLGACKRIAPPAKAWDGVGKGQGVSIVLPARDQ
jgi:hypothetical protein